MLVKHAQINVDLNIILKFPM